MNAVVDVLTGYHMHGRAASCSSRYPLVRDNEASIEQ